MVGSILLGTLLVRSPLSDFFISLLTIVEIWGSCLFVAGYKERDLMFNVDLTSITSSLMIVSSASLLIPSASYFANLRSNHIELGDYILTLSYIAAVILLVFYILYLVFQLKTHVDIFTESNQGRRAKAPNLILGLLVSFLY